uniref:Abnormal cell migration protein 18-like fibronectin type I domain-containing protein n=1 Tax=Steinernema glaseri TaxID=37863 RepID=A0A1I7Z5E1_9BILA
MFKTRFAPPNTTSSSRAEDERPGPCGRCRRRVHALVERGGVTVEPEWTLIGCRKEDEIFNEGQIWTDKHIRYQCLGEGALKVLGCIDDGGLFIDLGRDILMNGVVHRCYRINHTTFYHR